jgi:hypothetical protein
MSDKMPDGYVGKSRIPKFTPANCAAVEASNAQKPSMYAHTEKPKLKKGDKVRVYQKPLTNEDEEGIATLVKFDSVSEGYGTERWLVRFEGEESTYPRDVKFQNRC